MAAGRGGGFERGDHVCWRYGDDDERRAVLTTFLCEGVERTEQLVCFVRRGGGADVAGYLADHCDVAGLVERGQLVVVDAEDVYTPEGHFDPEARLGDLQRRAAAATAAGWAGLRVYAEVGWLVGRVVDPTCWSEYELRADLLISQLPYVALCGYDLREWEAGSFDPVDAVHGRTLDGGGRPSPFHLHGTGDGAVAMSGEVDYASADLAGRLLTASGRQLSPPVIDLSALSFVDAAGTAAIFNAARALPDVDLRDAPPLVDRIWQLLGYDEVLRLVPPELSLSLSP